MMSWATTNGAGLRTPVPRYQVSFRPKFLAFFFFFSFWRSPPRSLQGQIRHENLPDLGFRFITVWYHELRDNSVRATPEGPYFCMLPLVMGMSRRAIAWPLLLGCDYALA